MATSRAVALALAVALAAAAAPPETGAGPRVDLVLHGTTLRQALDALSRQTGLVIVVAEAVDVDGAVDVDLEGVEAERALELLLRGAGLR